MTKPKTLEVSFCGEVRSLNPDETLEFGRGAELEIDENRFLHRILGRFFCRDGQWWLANVGRNIPISVHDVHSRSEATIDSGTEQLISYSAATVRFAAGSSNYELEILRPGHDEPDITLVEHSDTVSAADLPLTQDQRLLIVVLSEDALTTGRGDFDIPPNRVAALRLGWKITRFNRKLDNVCQKLSKAGVSGLHGGSGGLAFERRNKLVKYAVESGLVTTSDLDLLPSR